MTISMTILQTRFKASMVVDAVVSSLSLPQICQKMLFGYLASREVDGGTRLWVRSLSSDFEFLGDTQDSIV